MSEVRKSFEKLPFTGEKRKNFSLSISKKCLTYLQLIT